MALGVENDGHVAMPFAGAGFVNHQTAHLAPVLGGMGLRDIVLQHSRVSHSRATADTLIC